jgi:hypothetical protein
MINDEVKVKLIDIAWDIVKTKNEFKMNNTAALAKQLSMTFHELYINIKDTPDFQDDIWRYTSRKN